MKNIDFNDENIAWDKFISTGSVKDYLSYTVIRRELKLKEKNKIENQHGGTSSIRTNCG